MWRVFGESRLPDSSFTRHLPHAPLPEQGASMATLARWAACSRLSPSWALILTSEPLTLNVIVTIALPPAARTGGPLSADRRAVSCLNFNFYVCRRPRGADRIHYSICGRIIQSRRKPELRIVNAQ